MIRIALLLLSGPLGESILIEEDGDEESGMLIFEELRAGAKLILGARRWRLTDESIYAWFCACLWGDYDDNEEGRCCWISESKSFASCGEILDFLNSAWILLSVLKDARELGLGLVFMLFGLVLLRNS